MFAVGGGGVVGWLGVCGVWWCEYGLLMDLNGPGGQRGHVLLIAGDGVVCRRRVELAPSANVAALAMVPAGVLLGSAVPCDSVSLDGVRDPNTVLTRLRTAAAAPGPLLLYLSGRLTADRRGRRLYLALAGTTQASVRYTSLPWEWLGTELRGREAALTTVLVDLAADKEAWPLLREYGSWPAFGWAQVYGVVSPPGVTAAGGGVSGYTRQWIDQLRHSHARPANVALHALAAASAALAPGTLVLPTARELGMRSAPPHLKPYPNPQRQGQPEPYPNPQSQVQPLPQARQRAPEQVPDSFHIPVPVPASPPAPAQTTAPNSAPIPVPARAPAPGPVPDSGLMALPAQASGPAADFAGTPVPAQPPARAQVLAQASGSDPGSGWGGDPRPHFHALAVGGRHLEAAALARAWEQHVVGTCGYASPEAAQWAEIRADLARMAGDFSLATRLWISAGQSRLAWLGAGDPGVGAAAAGALYCWTQLKDAGAAVEFGPELLALLRVLSSPDPRHLPLVQQRLEALRTHLHHPRALHT